jgi:hypothetical protein
MGELSAADVAAVTRPNFGYGMGYGMGCGGFGMGGWEGIIGLIVLAGIFGGGFGGFGGNGGGWQQGFNTQNILSKLDGITNGISDATYALNNSINGINMNLSNALCSTTYELASKIDANRFAAQQCCCETQRAIDGVKFQTSQNTCDIVNAIHAEGEATRGLITQNTIQALRDKLADKDRDIQTRDFQLSQLSQNSYLINKLQPCPVPAYQVCNPFQPVNTSGCGCNGYQQ